MAQGSVLGPAPSNIFMYAFDESMEGMLIKSVVGNKLGGVANTSEDRIGSSIRRIAVRQDVAIGG